jgi:hypothetical protein
VNDEKWFWLAAILANPPFAPPAWFALRTLVFLATSPLANSPTAAAIEVVEMAEKVQRSPPDHTPRIATSSLAASAKARKQGAAFANFEDGHAWLDIFFLA